MKYLIIILVALTIFIFSLESQNITTPPTQNIGIGSNLPSL